MKPLNRRAFLRNTAVAVGAGLAFRGTARAWAQPVGSNAALRVGVIGVGRKGSDLVSQVLQCAGVRLVAICDVDPRPLAKQRDALAKDNVTVFATTDARRLIEREDVDAVIVASPNHWHALHTIWACQAGKDVYVEKPVSHSVWEGVQMTKAAKRHGRVVQAGTQMRSDVAMPELIRYLREGHIGKILWIHSICYKARQGIGRRLPWYPDWLDYDLFCGPAPVVPLVRDELAYDWHWYWDTGNGDQANIGIHEFDVARWIAGHESAPRGILSIGGRFGFDDTGETPNTQLTFFDYPNIPIFLENRVLPAKPGVKYMDHIHGVRQGAYVQCEGGSFAGRFGGTIFDRDGKKLKSFTGDGGGGHLDNFFNAVRKRDKASLAAPLETGIASTTPCLFGNISYRCGVPATLAQARNAVSMLKPAAPVLDSFASHLAQHGVALDRPSLTVGPWVRPDPALTGIESIADVGAGVVDRARYLLKGSSRPPYIIPESA